MRCRNKGKCCRELSDGKYLFEDINGDEVEMNVVDGTCEHLNIETGECKIYGRRPKVCEAWFCPYCEYE
jgi:Fe-S-cluster containining protein